MAGRFPKARNLDEFWRNLCNGVEAISFFTDEELMAEGFPKSNDPNFVKARAVLEHADWFDAAFFGMNPKEAELTDPQHRLFLECAWEALEDAGCDPERFGRPIGVFGGMSTNTYLAHNLGIEPQLLIGINGAYHAMIGNDKDFLTTRASYKLGLKGPSLNVQTACSTSLVAVCLACQQLLNYQCDLALAGAVSVSFPQRRGYKYQQGGITSPDGHCRPFDAKSAGTVAGEGVGMVALKRLEDALSEGDAIYAVIRGFATNNDGGVKLGYAAPSVEGQAEVIAMAQTMAECAPDTINYVETHGTGTPLGDPIEIEGLTRAFRLGTKQNNFCALGSVKSNIGHLDTAAGIAGLIKTVLALNHKLMPPSLHFEAPNPKINFADSPFYVNGKLQAWTNGVSPRRAGVSSFGIGGTNAHIVLEEAPKAGIPESLQPAQLLVLSARTEGALAAMAVNLARHLRQNPRLNLADVAYTLHTGRRSFEHRGVLVCADVEDAVAALESLPGKRFLTASKPRENPSVVFMFSGQGAQRLNMGRELYESEPSFRENVDRCARVLEPKLGLDLRSVLWPESQAAEAAMQRLNETAITQPALFVLEYCLAQLWMSWGIKPAAMIGHSIGEYVAACLAGVFSFEDALQLVAARGRLMQELPRGSMLAVRLPASEVIPLLDQGISIAAVNSTAECVVSGPSDAIKAFQLLLGERYIGNVGLRTSHAFHSAMMESVLEPFGKLVENVSRQEPSIPFISNVTGTWITGQQATDPAYWASHLRQTVRFSAGLEELFKSCRVLLEIGPGQTLANLARLHPARDAEALVLASMPHQSDKTSERNTVLSALGQLWLAGVSPAWESFYAHEQRQKVRLPGYPFERQRYWAEPPRGQSKPDLLENVEETSVRAGFSEENEDTPTSLHSDSPGKRIGESKIQTESNPRPLTVERLRDLIARLSGLPAAQIDRQATFTQMGFDSLFLTQASVAVETEFGVRVAFRQFIEAFPTMESLAAHIEQSWTSADGAKAADVPQTAPQPVLAPDLRANIAPVPGGCVIKMPLTESQRELWFASQMGEAASSAYNECRLLHLEGPLQADALRLALQRLVERHEALRTTFAPGGDEQRILPKMEVDLPFVDWSHLQPAEQELGLDQLQLQQAQLPFDLAGGPLIRAGLFRRADERHLFIITVHHLVCDGYSFRILLQELARLYGTECGHPETRLAPPLQFSVYARAQVQQEQSAAHVANENYWLEQFASDTQVLELPTDRPRGVASSFAGARERLDLPIELSGALKRLSAQQGCTLFATLFAAYLLLLRRLTGQRDLVVGVPLADRAIPGGETLVGHCVNFLPLRATVEDQQSFSKNLAEMQRVFLNADEHGRYAYGTLIQKLSMPRSPGRMPLASATFNLERISEETSFCGLKTETTGNKHSSTCFEISFDVADGPAGLQINCRYNSGLFSSLTISRWLGHFQTLLEGIVAAPQRAVCEFPILSEAERQVILGDWNETTTDYPREKCVHQLFEEQAQRTPECVAIEFDNEQLTYGQLNRRANQLAHRMRKLGVSRDSIVAVCLERSLDMVVTLLGILKAGAAYLPLDPSHPRDRTRLMLEDAGVRIAVTQERFVSLFQDLHVAPAESTKSFAERGQNPSSHAFQIPRLMCVDLDRDAIDKESTVDPSGDLAATDLAYISFTSGSTGRPKGVCVPHRAIVRLVKNTDYADLTAREIFLQLAPLAFDASTFEIWAPLLNGGRLVIFPPHAPSLSELGEFVEARGISTLWLTAGLFQQMIEEQSSRLRGVRQLLAGGDVLPMPAVIRALQTLPGCRLINGYGPTENTTFSCCYTITEEFASRDDSAGKICSVPIGRPIANSQSYVLDAFRQPVPVGVVGELYVGGDGLARGYLNCPELTSEKFIPNPFGNGQNSRLYRTGDLVRWRPDGNLEFVGRGDTQLKIRGFRVELGEIEAVLSEHPSVRACAVAVSQDDPAGRRICAYFVSGEANHAAPEDLRKHLMKRLPDCMIPDNFVRLETMPLTANGKVDRCALPRVNQQNGMSGKPFVQTNDAVETQLAQIWENVLGRSAIGVDDDFFELGGHSLLALRLISRVETEFGRRLTAAGVFQARTVAQMARLLRDERAAQGTSVVEIQPRGTRPPLLLVHGAGGGMFWGYTALSECLGNDQPVFGFKAREVKGSEPYPGIEELAAQYVTDLRAFQPHGPYYLGGYCFGGNVAYEMARALRAAGEEVAMLALINCVPPNFTYDRVHVTPGFCLRFLKNLVYWGKYVLQLKQGQRRAFLGWKLHAIKSRLLHWLRPSDSTPLNFDIEDFVDLSAQPEGRRGLWEAHVKALFSHHPQPYPGHVHLFRTPGHSLLCSFDETLGWRELATGGLTVRIVPGAHETVMNEPHVRTLACEMQQCLNTCLGERDDAAASQDEKCVHELFEQQVTRTPDARAVIWKNGSITYAELNQRADKLARRLQRLGVAPDVPVGICIERSIEMVVAVLAILKAGGAYVPLDAANPRARLKLMLENARISLLLTQASLRAEFDSLSADLKIACVDDAETGPSNGAHNPLPQPENLAYVIHTSGSTGVPKGVAMPHRPLVNLIQWQCEHSRLGPGARTLQFAPLSFDVSFQEMFSTWCAGGTLVLAEEPIRRDPVALLRWVGAQKIERIFLPFVALQQLAEAFVEHSTIPLSLREIITAGEQLQITPAVTRFFENLPNATLHNQYGPSETHVVTAYDLSGAPGDWPKLPPIGRAISNVAIHLLDETCREVPAGEIGEIYLGGRCLARGYLNRPDLTQAAFVASPFSKDSAARLYRTGDLGRLLPDGNVEFLGRRDHQLKIRGFRVELGEIESTLRQHPAVRDAAVVAREAKAGGKALVAYYIRRSDATAQRNELRKFLSDRLPEYMVPSLYVPLESLPLTPSGKVDRKSLPVPESEQARIEALIPARTPLEEQLAAVWRDVLGLEEIGIEDNFFELGGHSLLAVQVVSRIRQTCHEEIPVAALFEAPTISLLAAGLSNDRWKYEHEDVALKSTQRASQAPLSFSQERLWFLQELEPASFAYNVPAAIRLEGTLDEKALGESLNEIIKRHEILRTTVATDEEGCTQAIAPDLSLPLAIVDLRQCSGSEEKESCMSEFIAAQSRVPFDLKRGPMIRCALLRLSPELHVLVVVMHHFVSDGWSLQIFFNELGKLYDSRMGRGEACLEPLPIQYADYAIWQREKSREGLLNRQLAFWQTSLAGAPPELKLPADRSGNGADSRGAHQTLLLQKTLSTALREFNRDHNCTSFMALLSALSILLYKWTRENDLVVGTVFAGRTRREMENLIGCFMNSLPIRIRLRGIESGAELLKNVKIAVLESQANADCPFEKMVQAIKPERRGLQNPIYNVGLLLQNFPRIAIAARYLTGRFVSLETDSALLDLRFVADEIEEGVSLACEYRTSLFNSETISQLLLSFQRILQILIEHPETPLDSFSLVPALDEQKRAANGQPVHRLEDSSVSNGETGIGSSPIQPAIAITATFTAEPVQEALQFWLTELDLAAEVQFAPYNQVFQQLLDPGSLLGCNRLGLNVVLVRPDDWGRGEKSGNGANPASGQKQALHEFFEMLSSAAKRSSTEWLVCICPSRTDDFSIAVPALPSNVRVVLPEDLSQIYAVQDPFDDRADELGHVPYTSQFYSALATLVARTFNSLRRPAPKVIVLDCDRTLWPGICGEDGASALELDPPHRALQEFMRGQLEAGRLLCLCSKNNPEDVQAVFREHPEMPLRFGDFAASRVNWRPKSENLKALAEELNLGLDSFVLVDDDPLECAEVQANCPGALALQLPESTGCIPGFLEHCWLFDRRKATAEDVQRTAFYHLERRREQARAGCSSLDEFLAGLELKVRIGGISDDQIARVAQLTQRTNQFTCSTRRRTEADLRNLLHNGILHGLSVSVSDRFGDYGLVGAVLFELKDDRLAVDTFLLSCRALGRGVEHQMLSHVGELASRRGIPRVDVAFVPSAKNNPAHDFLESVGKAFSQADNGGSVYKFPAEIAAAVEFRTKVEEVRPMTLAPVSSASPQTFTRWRWLAWTTSDARRIHELIEGRARPRISTVAKGPGPASELERNLCEIWSRLLRIDRVGVRDNFFDLGGHSLLAVRLFSSIESLLGIKLPLVTIFQSPTVEQLVQAIGAQSAQPDSMFLPIQPAGEKPPLFLVHGAGGDVLWGYANVAHYLDPDQPIYGIRTSPNEAFATLEEMAAFYVRELRRFHPGGPYRLGGYCFGGNVAQEMARQLEAQGESTDFLALLDCAPSNRGYERAHWWRIRFFPDFANNLECWLEDFLRLKPEEQRSLVGRKLRAWQRRVWQRLRNPASEAGFDLEEIIDLSNLTERDIHLWKNHLTLLLRHRSGVYCGHITLFKTRGHPILSSFAPDFGWGELAGKVTLRNISGSHEGIFLEPNVRSLASQLQSALRDADVSGNRPVSPAVKQQTVLTSSSL